MMNELPVVPEQIAAELAPDLAILRAVAARRNITRAAELLEIPQPTLSRRLAALGRRLDAPVTVRDGRGVRLTRVGQVLADAAGRSLSTLEAGVRQVIEEIEPDRGHVVLGFLHLMGRLLVPTLLRDFRAVHPGIRFSLSQGSQADILAMLADGTIDLALIAPMDELPADLDGVVLAEQELLVNVDEGHRLAGRREVAFVELADEPFVALEPGYGMRQITDRLCAEAGFQPRIAFEGQESDTVRGLVAAGLGVALLPKYEPGAPTGVVELPLSPRVTRALGLVWPAAAQLTPAVRAFRDFVAARAPTARAPAGGGARPSTRY